MQVREKRYTEHRTKVNGLRIHYADWGNPHLPHMFLAHGAVANAAYWDLVAPAFRDRYHVVAVTARGRGKSDYSPDGKYDTEDYVQDFRDLTVQVGLDKLIYVGQSMGGKIGMSYAAMYPEQVERMILVDVGGETARPPTGDPIKERPEVFNTLSEAETWLRKFDRFSRLGSEAMEIVLQTSFHQLINEQWASTIAHALVEQGQRGTGHGRPISQPTWDILPNIQCPTLLIHGTLSDLQTPDIARRTRDAIPNCELVEIEAGHLLHLEQPGECIRVVEDFLGD